jgi:hypothetical protein
VTAENTEPIIPSTGSTPTDAHLELTACLAKVLLEVARRRQDELPGLTETLQDQVLVTSGGTNRHVDGWFQARAWRHGNRTVHELFLNASYGDHDPRISAEENVLVTLLHEAAHVWASANNVRDTSRDGRYHNRRFAEIALAIGLQVERDATIGHRTPRLSVRGRYDYADLLGELKDGLTLSRISRPVRSTRNDTEEGAPAAGLADPDAVTPITSKYVFASCQCQTGRGLVTIRMSRGSWRPGIIGCGGCGSAFAESLTSGRQNGRDESVLERPVGKVQ